MVNCLPHTKVHCLAREKHKDFLEEREIGRDVVGLNSILFLSVGFLSCCF